MNGRKRKTARIVQILGILSWSLNAKKSFWNRLTQQRHSSKFLSEYETEIQQASLFEKDLITHVNPGSKTVNKMFAWGIEPQHCKTSHDGMKKVFYKLGENFQFFCVDENERRCLGFPNSDSRRIHLCVDQ
jgi:hypothetical protein